MIKKIEKYGDESKKGKKKYLIIFVIIFLIATFFRLYLLDLRPVHWDEGGAHAFFSRDVFISYMYDPVFHGPFLYHITGIIFIILGENIITLRILQALFGIALILLVFMLRKHIGTFGIIIAALFLTISPSMIYYSKFALHDPFFVFFTLLCIVSLLFYSTKKEKEWLYLFALSTGFLVTIKENSYIFLFVLFSYFILACIFDKSFRKDTKNLIKKEKKILFISLCLFLLVIILFYTSFFRFWNNIIIFIKTLFYWVSASGQGGHVKSFSYFLELLVRFELPIFVFGILGIFTAVIKRENKVYRFLVYWALLTLLLMSIIKYKTPWNIIHLVLPFSILSGIFFNEIFKFKRLKVIAIIFLILSVGFLTYQATDLNFYNYSNEKYSLVYVQTGDEIKTLLNNVKNYEEKYEVEDKNVSILVAADAWWPLPWYWREEEIEKLKIEVLFYENYLEDNNSSQLYKYNIIIISKKDKEKYENFLQDYGNESYHIRNGVDWIGYFKIQ